MDRLRISSGGFIISTLPYITCIIKKCCRLFRDNGEGERMSEEKVLLKPCKICGGRAWITEVYYKADSTRYVIQCDRCGCKLDHKQEFNVYHKYDRVGNFIGYEKIAIGMSAIDVWNGKLLEVKE